MALSFLKPNSKDDQPSNQYQWKVTDESTISRIRSKKQVESPIFRMHGFAWRLEFHVDFQNTSDNSTLVLKLMSMPPKFDRVATMFTLYCDELEVESSEAFTFTKGPEGRGWFEGQCTTSDVMKLSSFTFRTEIQIIAIYNKEGDDVTATHVDTVSLSGSAPTSNVSKSIQELNVRMDSLTEAVEMMQNTMRMMQTRMDKEEKKYDSNLRQEINEMKEALKRVTMTMSVNEENTEEVIFKKWVVDTLKYPEYFDLFIENGVDTLNVAKLLTKNELKAIGINKIGHQLKIMEAIQSLKIEPNHDEAVPAYQQPVEGSTLML